jgi:hypothetical protein
MVLVLQDVQGDVQDEGVVTEPAAKRSRLALSVAGNGEPRVARSDLSALEASAAGARVPEDRVDSKCMHCPLLSPKDYPVDLQPLWLHAGTYKCEDWSFSAPWPDWAAEGFDAG